MIPTCCYRHAIQLGRHDGGFCAGKLGGTVAATGHRPEFLGGYQHCHSLEAYAQDAIVFCGAEKLICGMALGWDAAVAVACVRLGVPFIAAVPFVGQERIWPKESQDLYQHLLSRASEVVVVNPGGFASWKFISRDHWMIDNSQRVLALWNGQRHGGTYQCVKYAEKKKHPIHHVWDGWMEKLNAA
jgi:uncharacterized phage-like protein YoqJ